MHYIHIGLKEEMPHVQTIQLLLKEQYREPAWQRKIMLPWMYDTYPTLGDFYVPLEIYLKSTTTEDKIREKPCTEYGDFFNYTRMQRIILQAPPGYGKTIFTHIIAHDWATTNLIEFDLVFLLKLREINPNHTISKAIIHQFSLSNDAIITPKIIGDFLLSKEHKVLLILDGLDEIILDEYKYVKNLVQGKVKLRASLMLSTRPHEISEEVIMTFDSMLHIKGFSHRLANQYLIKITKGNKKLIQEVLDKDHLSKIATTEKMSNGQESVHFSPFLVHCVVLITGNVGHGFPDTETGFFMALVKAILQKQSKDMTTAERDETFLYSAMLAYEGLISNNLKLSAIELNVIENENLFKLGLLYGYDKRRIFTVRKYINWIHPCIQHFLSAFYVIHNMKQQDPEPLKRALIESRNIFNGGFARFLIGK